MKLAERFKNGYNAFKGLDAETSKGWRELADFLGIDHRDKEAMSEATYFACLKILSESMGKLPLKLLKEDTDGGIRSAKEHPCYKVLNFRPNRFMTATAFWSAMELNRNHHGNSYAWIEGAGKAMNLWPLPPDEVDIWYDNNKMWSDIPEIFYIWSHGGKQYRFTSEEILHYRSSNTIDGIKGISVLDQLKSTIQGNIKSQEVANKLFDRGMTSKLVVQYTGSLSDENAKLFAKGIEEYASGAVKDVKEVIPVPPGATVTPLNMKLSDSQYIDIRKHSALQIAAAFGIKPTQLNDYSKASYSSQEQQQISFYIDTLLFPLRHYEEETQYKLLTEADTNQGFYPKFNVFVLMRTDLKTQISTLSTGVKGSLYTPNEARAYLDLPSVPGGDVLMANGASIPVSMIGAQYVAPEGGEKNE